MSDNYMDSEYTTGPEANKALVMDIAKARVAGVYFDARDETGTSDVDVIIGVTGSKDPEGHGHYFGFRRHNGTSEGGDVLAMVRFDCPSYHGFVQDLRSTDMLDDNSLMNMLSLVFRDETPNLN